MPRSPHQAQWRYVLMWDPGRKQWRVRLEGRRDGTGAWVFCGMLVADTTIAIDGASATLLLRTLRNGVEELLPY